jgi:hypothetical protein
MENLAVGLENNIKTNLNELECEGMNSIYLQNYWVFWIFSIVWYSREHDVSETGSVSVLR